MAGGRRLRSVLAPPAAPVRARPAVAHFTQSLTCSRPTGTGRITLSGGRLIETVNGRRAERVLAEPEILDAYRTHFGIELERVPSLANPG